MNEFVAEAEELIETVYQNLKTIGKNLPHAMAPAEQVNAMFRSLHTLKGIAEIVGLKSVSQLTHRLESLLDHLRMGRHPFDPEVAAILQEGTDILQNAVRAKSLGVPSSGGQEKAASFIEEKIATICAELHAPLSSDGADGGSPFLNTFTEYEQHRLRENMREGLVLYDVTARFDMNDFDTALPALQEQLRQNGEIITTSPLCDLSPNEGMSFRMIVGVPSENHFFETMPQSKSLSIQRISFAQPTPQWSPTPDVPFSRSLVVKMPASPLFSSLEKVSIQSLTRTVRVDTDKLSDLTGLVGELSASRAALQQISEVMSGQNLPTSISREMLSLDKRLEKQVNALQEKLIEIRMIPIGQIFERLQRTVRQVSKELNKEVNLILSGEDISLEKEIVEALADPLLHMILNALDHGIEERNERVAANKPPTGTIYVRTRQQGGRVVIQVEDDGRGIDTQRVYHKALQAGLIDPTNKGDENDLLKLLFFPGFSTRDTVTQISGRGVGLDVVHENISRLSGDINIETVLGRGTLLTLTLPMTLAFVNLLVVRVGEGRFGIPLDAISEGVTTMPPETSMSGSLEEINHRDKQVPLVRLRDLLGITGAEDPPSDQPLYRVKVGQAERVIQIIVDDIEGHQKVIMKSLGGVLKGIPGISGAAEWGNRKVMLVLDIDRLIDEVGKEPRRRNLKGRVPLKAALK